jgi:hypothetical protein
VFAALSDYEFARIERGGKLVSIGIDNLHEWQNMVCLPR